MSNKSLEEKIALLSPRSRYRVEGYVDAKLEEDSKFSFSPKLSLNIPEIKKEEEPPKPVTYDLFLFKWTPRKYRNQKEDSPKSGFKKRSGRTYNLEELPPNFRSQFSPRVDEDVSDSYDECEDYDDSHEDIFKSDQARLKKMLEEGDFERIQAYWREKKNLSNFDL